MPVPHLLGRAVQVPRGVTAWAVGVCLMTVEVSGLPPTLTEKAGQQRALVHLLCLNWPWSLGCSWHLATHMGHKFPHAGKFTPGCCESCKFSPSQQAAQLRVTHRTPGASLEQRPGHCFQELELLNEFMLRKRQVTFITESGELNIHIYLLKKIIYICSKALPSLKDKHHLVTKLKK